MCLKWVNKKGFDPVLRFSISSALLTGISQYFSEFSFRSKKASLFFMLEQSIFIPEAIVVNMVDMSEVVGQGAGGGDVEDVMLTLKCAGDDR